jgi:hypothetical protein
MEIANDMIIFTKKDSILTVAMLSCSLKDKQTTSQVIFSNIFLFYRKN